jgi:cephalosporin hydroxylase
MGIPTRKFVNDLWMYQEIVHERRPDFIVEIGSWYGGATLFLAHLLDNLGSGQVVSVDISRHDYQIRHPRVIEVTANSNDLSTFEKVREICHGGTVMVIHDGAHGCDDVLRDLTLYGPLVSPGQYLIVEDGVIDLFENVPRTIGAKFHTKYPLGGPLRAIATFLETPPRVFEIDETRERFLMTASPRGYLLKTSQS